MDIAAATNPEAARLLSAYVARVSARANGRRTAPSKMGR